MNESPGSPAATPAEALSDFIAVTTLGPASPPETAALALLRALGVGPGARVVLPVWGSAGLAESLELGGYEVVALDVDPDTGRLDVSAVAREQSGFEALWMHDVNGLPPEASRLKALARARDAVVVEEVRESLGAHSSGDKVGSHADAVVLRGPDGRARIGSVSGETVEEASRNLPNFERSSVEAECAPDPGFEAWVKSTPARLAGQRRLASILESAWGPLDALSLPDYSAGTRGTWPRYPVRVLTGAGNYPNAAWTRWLHARQVSVARPLLRLVHGLDPDDRHVRREFPGAVEYLRRTLCFPCGASVTLQEAERTVYAVDELARRESDSRA